MSDLVFDALMRAGLTWFLTLVLGLPLRAQLTAIGVSFILSGLKNPRPSGS